MVKFEMRLRAEDREELIHDLEGILKVVKKRPSPCGYDYSGGGGDGPDYQCEWTFAHDREPLKKLKTICR